MIIKMDATPASANSTIATPLCRLRRGIYDTLLTRMMALRVTVNCFFSSPGMGMRETDVYVTVTRDAIALPGPLVILVAVTVGLTHVVTLEPIFGSLRSSSRTMLQAVSVASALSLSVDVYRTAERTPDSSEMRADE